ncbi:MAG: hypothetical protein LC746_18385 [Acidobacteria bacterium]|nr:hypothetical protein [Acidobacteriota bacterium]
MIVALPIPFETVDVPEWKVRVIDQNDEPLSGATIREHWKNYSLDLKPGENGDERQTDSNGYVVFPERRTSASLLRRIVNTLVSGAMVIAHGSAGIYAEMMVVGDTSENSIKQWRPGRPLPTEIVVPRASYRSD